MTTDPADLADCDLVVEAIVEDPEAKAELLRDARRALPGRRPGDDDLVAARSASSADAAASPGRFFGLHVFNPVAQMELVELCLPDGLRDGRRASGRTRWCAALGKTAVEVPDQAGLRRQPAAVPATCSRRCG